MPELFTIHLNGLPLETRAATVAELLLEQGFAEGCVATALDGAFVPKQARAEVALLAGAKVEVLAPMQGG